jgi:hypothetical protein
MSILRRQESRAKIQIQATENVAKVRTATESLTVSRDSVVINIKEPKKCQNITTLEGPIPKIQLEDVPEDWTVMDFS